MHSAECRCHHSCVCQDFIDAPDETKDVPVREVFKQSQFKAKARPTARGFVTPARCFDTTTCILAITHLIFSNLLNMSSFSR
eukprot:5727520-Pleurochrysis_carterae.AAC.2